MYILGNLVICLIHWRQFNHIHIVQETECLYKQFVLSYFFFNKDTRRTFRRDKNGRRHDDQTRNVLATCQVTQS